MDKKTTNDLFYVCSLGQASDEIIEHDNIDQGEFERSIIMNEGQKMFYNFFMNMVQEGKEQEAEKALAESFEKQANGTFDAEYLKSIMPKYYSLIKPECTEQLKKAMEHFASNL